MIYIIAQLFWLLSGRMDLGEVIEAKKSQEFKLRDQLGSLGEKLQCITFGNGSKDGEKKIGGKAFSRHKIRHR